MPDKRYCTIQVDADGLWVLRRLLGKPAPIDPDPVFEVGIKRILKLFDEFDIKATFFVVARDLESRDKVQILRQVAAAGHEIASHGAAHLYVNSLDAAGRRDEIISSKKLIGDLLGLNVSGFKSAGFASYGCMAQDVEAAGYLYDSSVFGTSLAFLMEFFSGLSYPKWGMARAPNSPYHPSRTDIFRKGDSPVVEMPVTAMPWLRLPMHFSYAMLGGSAYSNVTTRALKASGVQFVNYLFHPLDMVDTESVHITEKVRGLNITAARKLSLARKILSSLKDRYEVMTSRRMCDSVKELL